MDDGSIIITARRNEKAVIMKVSLEEIPEDEKHVAVPIFYIGLSPTKDHKHIVKHRFRNPLPAKLCDISTLVKSILDEKYHKEIIDESGLFTGGTSSPRPPLLGAKVGVG